MEETDLRQAVLPRSSPDIAVLAHEHARKLFTQLVFGCEFDSRVAFQERLV